jgi:putative membrane protein
MLWIKALHIVFIVSWMSGLFYLPRIFVNLALETPGPTTERLLTMARKLYRFTTMLALPAVVFGIWLVVLQYGARMPGWLHAKLFVVFLLLGYHHACGALLKKFERGANQRGHVFYRWFNEVPVLMLLAIVILVVVKPF